MIKEIVRNVENLEKSLKKVDKSEKQETSTIIRDLLDTAGSYGEECLGLAANQIGYDKRIIVARMGKDASFKPMVNPVIIAHGSKKIASKEGCLSLEGERIAQRWLKVTVMYQDGAMKLHKEELSGMQAIIVQHEIDHTNGILI